MRTNRMHRSNRLLRTIMAMLLIVAMTVQQGAYVLADETVPQPVTEASTPQTQAAFRRPAGNNRARNEGTGNSSAGNQGG